MRHAIYEITNPQSFCGKHQVKALLGHGRQATNDKALARYSSCPLRAVAVHRPSFVAINQDFYILIVQHSSFHLPVLRCRDNEINKCTYLKLPQLRAKPDLASGAGNL